MDRFSQFFHQVIRKKVLYVTYIHNDFHFTCNMLLHNSVKVENAKMLPNFHVETDNTFN